VVDPSGSLGKRSRIESVVRVGVLFSSNIFIFVFLPAILAIYYLTSIVTSRITALNVVLFCFSVFFYFWGNGFTAVILLGSIALNFAHGRLLDPSRAHPRRKLILIDGVLANLAILFYFKYAGFTYQNLRPILSGLGIALPPDFEPPLLPVGVSFFTFMSTAYLIEVYRTGLRARSLLDYGLYLSLFAHLVAGPIVRYSELKNEIESRHLSSKALFEGVWRFCIGLGKKVLIADNLAITADAAYGSQPGELTVALAWLGAICYAFQIFFDFSGYTDMAIGIARMFGFHFPENFAQPYRAASITEFWRRWHMTLTRWFRDFVYIPLGGNRRGGVRTYLNLIVVFLLCGLWHGAAWTFVTWGMYHGLLLVMERILSTRFNFQGRGLVGVILTFLLVMVGWVFFRATTLEQSWSYLATMVGRSSHPAATLPISHYLTNSTMFFLLVAAALAFAPAMPTLLPRLPKPLFVAFRGTAALTILVLSLGYLSDATFAPFIYFRF
jgi:alginate O-acetyltransferase complex protein AlgI